MTGHIPDGFTPHGRSSPVTDAWEPLFSRGDGGVVRLGARLAERHCNSRGLLHGGVIAALADNAMGLSYGATLALAAGERPGGIVTLSLNIDYVSSARIGAWLEIAPRVVRAGRSIGFVDAIVTADGEAVARASATFKLLARDIGRMQAA